MELGYSPRNKKTKTRPTTGVFFIPTYASCSCIIDIALSFISSVISASVMSWSCMPCSAAVWRTSSCVSPSAIKLQPFSIMSLQASVYIRFLITGINLRSISIFLKPWREGSQGSLATVPIPPFPARSSFCSPPFLSQNPVPHPRSS